jgi:superfamily II DNA/RNA helicase
MYADTLSYLYSATDDLGIQVYKATGVDSFAERQATIQGFLEQGGLLVSTDAGLEGATLQEVAHVIHYDLPSNPKILDQRLGRFDRYGREVPCTMYLLRDESGAMPVEFPPTDSIISEHRSRMLSGGSGTGEE